MLPETCNQAENIKSKLNFKNVLNQFDECSLAYGALFVKDKRDNNQVKEKN